MYQIFDDGGQASESSASTTQPSMASTSSTRKHLKVMIVGDSMTHGEEGDHTWRYRIWEWFRDSAPDVKVDFVGPMTGTVPPQVASPPQPPRLPEEDGPNNDRDMNAGGYAKDVSDKWERYHFSMTGKQMAAAKETIEEQVRTLKPDMLLVMLGFNDMAWFVGGPEITIERAEGFIANARAANPKIQIALANVPHCKGGHANLRSWTSQYNCMLPGKIEEWNTAESPVEFVEIERNYGESPDGSKGMFDGLHPNELGELQIARGFTQTLHRAFKIGKGVLQVPKDVPKRSLPVPAHPKAMGVPYGIRFTCDPVYGSRGYDVRQRTKGQENFSESHVGAPQVDHSFASAGQEYEFQVRASGGTDQKGEWSEIVSGIARRETAPPPKNGKLYAIPTGFEVTWDEVDDSWNVDRYAMVYINKTGGGFLCAKGARGNHGKVDDLNPGDRFEVWLQTWTDLGPGVLGGLGMVVVGSGVFSRPANVKEKKEDGRVEK